MKKKIFLKKIIISVIVVLVILLSIKGAFFSVPIPDYLPIDKHWDLEERCSAKGYFFYFERIYCRFTISKPSEEIKESIHTIISTLSEWRSMEELSGQEIRSIIEKEINETYPDLKEEDPQYYSEIYKQALTQKITPLSQVWDAYPICTEQPFVFLSYFGQKDDTTHWYIKVRIIQDGEDGCVLELLDYQNFDH